MNSVGTAKKNVQRFSVRPSVRVVRRLAFQRVQRDEARAVEQTRVDIKNRIVEVERIDAAQPVVRTDRESQAAQSARLSTP